MSTHPLEQRFSRHSDRELLLIILALQGGILTAIDDLRSAVQQLQANVSAEDTELGAVAAALASAEQTITSLQSQIAAGAGVTAADLEGLASSIATVAQSAADATTAAQGGAAPASPAAPPAPTDPGAPPADPPPANPPTG